MNALDFKTLKKNQEKIAVVTCYDYTAALIVADSDIDCILVGDSVAMVMHGHNTTIPATTEMMCAHIQAVAKGAGKKFIIGDMPFLNHRKSLNANMNCVQALMQAGAHAIKLEGVDGNETLIQHIVESGVPVMGHIGLTPQSAHQLGGFRVQGQNDESRAKLFQQAKALEAAGCFSIVLECVPADLAKDISQSLSIPTIGIGAGPDTDGQVLVWQDILGMNNQFKPKFLKHYLNGYSMMQEALNAYASEVKQQVYPSKEHCY